MCLNLSRIDHSQADAILKFAIHAPMISKRSFDLKSRLDESFHRTLIRNVSACQYAMKPDLIKREPCQNKNGFRGLALSPTALFTDNQTNIGETMMKINRSQLDIANMRIGSLLKNPGK